MLHTQYIHNLANLFNPYSNDSEFWKPVFSHLKEFVIIANLNLDPLADKLDMFYCPKPRASHRDPLAMLRSLILMHMLKISSITEWVQKTRSISFYALLAGFNSTPGIGTYYDFMKRLIDGPYHKPCEHILRPSSYCSGSHLRHLQKEKEDKKLSLDPHNSQSEALAKKLLADSQSPRPDDFYRILEDMQLLVGLQPSIEQGLIIDLNNITASGDGSILQTAASAFGRPSCDCKIKGVFECEHPRYYSTPTAQWCYDHHHDIFIFGDRYYIIATTHNGHDLPLLTIMPGGNESDFTLSLKAFDRLLKGILENNIDLRIHIFTGDCHHDSYAHYKYFAQKNVLPVIPLPVTAQNSYPHLRTDNNITLDTNGHPVCPGGLKMRRHEFNKRKQTHVYNCPVKRPARIDGKYSYTKHMDECPLKQDCAPESSLAPFVYIKRSDDPRLFPQIPRDSKQFKQTMNQRSACERLNSVFDSYKLDNAYRNPRYALIHLTLGHIAVHAAIRYEESVKNYDSPKAYFADMLNRIGVKYFDSS